MSILLDKLCITASSLNHILYTNEKIQNEKEKRMYKMCISTIKRIVNIKNDSNFMMQIGSNMEDSLIEQHFSDTEKYSHQRVCEKTFNIGGIDIPFRATLDVFNNVTKTIIEIKCAVLKKPDPNNIEHSDINHWINNVYCKEYNTQAQLQMLCCDDFQSMRFLVSAVKEKKEIKSQEERCLYTSKCWEKDENFLEKHTDDILCYWNMLQDVFDKFLKNDEQTLLDLYFEDEPKKNELLSQEVKDYIKDYLKKHDEKVAFETDSKAKLLEIKSSMKELNDLILASLPKGDQPFKFGRYSLTKQPASTTYKWAAIVKHKGIEQQIIDSLTEKEKEDFISTVASKNTVRILKEKLEIDSLI